LGSSPHLTKELAHILRQQLRLFHRGEMTALRHHGPSPDIICALGPMPWRTHRLTREQCDRSGSLDSSAWLEPPRMMSRFVVQPRRRINRLRDPVDHRVGQDLIAREALLDVAVTVAPRTKFLDDP